MRAAGERHLMGSRSKRATPGGQQQLPAQDRDREQVRLRRHHLPDPARHPARNLRSGKAARAPPQEELHQRPPPRGVSERDGLRQHRQGAAPPGLDVSAAGGVPGRMGEALSRLGSGGIRGSRNGARRRPTMRPNRPGEMFDMCSTLGGDVEHADARVSQPLLLFVLLVLL